MRRLAERAAVTSLAKAIRCAVAGAAGMLAATAGMAQNAPSSLADCVGIADDRSRLACFDRIAADSGAHVPAAAVEAIPADRPDGAQARLPLPAPAAAVPAGPEQAAVLAGDDGADKFSLARHWEVGQENKRGVFAFRPHRPNYIVANYSRSPNAAPYRPFRASAPDADLSHGELAFQLGFKMKAVENLLDSPADLWFGYTQESFWQAGNHEASSPFRESNYQPELMLVMPADFALLGMRARFVNLGFVHQSNGQASTLSRSWNRVYAQLGLERGNFTLVGRVWKRLNEDAGKDDNPDINDFLGYGDLLGTYRQGGHELSFLARRNFRTGHGALQLGWAFPLTAQLKGYAQFFSGYGQSLIDYNYAQQTLGLGLLVSY